MRIVTWNCQMAFAKKKELLLKQNPDIAIIQECSRKDLESLQDQSFQTIWFGNIPYKGIGVLYRSQWSIRPVAEPIFPWIVPVEFEGPERFRLIAVWSCPKKTSFSHYVACTSEAIAAHPEWLEDGPESLFRDARTVVPDRNRRPAVQDSRIDFDGRPFGSVADGVAEHIFKSPMQQLAVSDYRGLAVGIEDEVASFGPGLLRAILDQPFQQFVESDLFLGPG